MTVRIIMHSSWHISSKKLPMLLHTMQLSTEGPEKPAGFTDGDTESEGSWVASIGSEKKMDAFSAPKSTADWASVLWPPTPLSTHVWRTVGKMEWRILIFQWYFMTASIPTLWKIQQENQRFTEETAMVTLCDREDPNHTNQACHSLLMWREQERIYKNIQNTQWVTHCKVESGGNGSILSLKGTLSF